MTLLVSGDSRSRYPSNLSLKVTSLVVRETPDRTRPLPDRCETQGSRGSLVGRQDPRRLRGNTETRNRNPCRIGPLPLPPTPRTKSSRYGYPTTSTRHPVPLRRVGEPLPELRPPIDVSGPTTPTNESKPTFLSSKPVEKVTLVERKRSDLGCLDPGTSGVPGAHQGDQITTPVRTSDDEGLAPHTRRISPLRQSLRVQ